MSSTTEESRAAKRLKSDLNSDTEKFDVHIVEDHNEALESIYQTIGARRRLDFAALTLLHFDSHPDLGIPDQLAADSIYDKRAVLELVSIESWILPAVYAGHISTLVWVKPRWSSQIEAGEYRVRVGKHAATGRIRCDSRESYFVSEGLYESELTNVRELLLYVCDFDQAVGSNGQIDPILTRILKTSRARNLILDIDLDFFSTMDPFRRMFANDHDYELFKSVYKTSGQTDLAALSKDDFDFDAKYHSYVTKKRAQLDEIYSAIKSRMKEEEKEGTMKTDVDKLAHLIASKQLDLDLIHSFGSGLDDRALPDHVSSRAELDDMIDAFGVFLRTYLATTRPGLVTVARSSLDDYCPPQQVELIQELTLNELNLKWKEHIGSVVKNY